jgi:hypothetical protein
MCQALPRLGSCLQMYFHEPFIFSISVNFARLIKLLSFHTYKLLAYVAVITKLRHCILGYLQPFEPTPSPQQLFIKNSFNIRCQSSYLRLPLKCVLFASSFLIKILYFIFSTVPHVILDLLILKCYARDYVKNTEQEVI